VAVPHVAPGTGAALSDAAMGLLQDIAAAHRQSVQPMMLTAQTSSGAGEGTTVTVAPANPDDPPATGAPTAVPSAPTRPGGAAAVTPSVQTENNPANANLANNVRVTYNSDTAPETTPPAA